MRGENKFNSPGLNKKYRLCSHGNCGLHSLMSDDEDRVEEAKRIQQLKEDLREREAKRLKAAEYRKK